MNVCVRYIWTLKYCANKIITSAQSQGPDMVKKHEKQNVCILKTTGNVIIN